MVFSVSVIPHLALASANAALNAMADLHITSVGLLREDELVMELSDGRSLTFSLEKLLALVPNAVVNEEDATKDDAEFGRKGLRAASKLDMTPSSELTMTGVSMADLHAILIRLSDGTSLELTLAQVKELQAAPPGSAPVFDRSGEP